MMLVAGRLRTLTHVSTHVSLAQAVTRARPERILQVDQCLRT